MVSTIASTKSDGCPTDCLLAALLRTYTNCTIFQQNVIVTFNIYVIHIQSYEECTTISFILNLFLYDVTVKKWVAKY